MARFGGVVEALEVFFLSEEGSLLGGAIMAARGSSGVLSFASGSDLDSIGGIGVVGGGPKAAGVSAGSSPGNIHLPALSS